MTISETVRRELYKRAGGRCECEMTDCAHHGGARCPHPLVAGFEAHCLNPDGLAAPSNLVAMCASCLAKTRRPSWCDAGSGADEPARSSAGATAPAVFRNR